MKQLILFCLAVTAFAFSANAQCDKTLRLTSSRTDYLNSTFQVQGGKDENVVIDITKTMFTITPNGNEDDAMRGKIKEMTCDWKVPFKEGKTIIKTDLQDASGDTKDAVITIEGKDGKITALLEAKGMPDRKLKLQVNKFEEAK